VTRIIAAVAVLSEHEASPGRIDPSVEPLSHAILQKIVDSTREGVLLVAPTSPGFTIAFANRAYEAQSGYSAAELVGTAWSTHFADRADSPELIELKRAIACHESCRLRIPFIRKDGAIWRAEADLTLLDDPADGQLYLVQHRRVEAGTEPAAQRSLPRRMARVRLPTVALDRADPVTGLFSLDYFVNLLRRDLSIARRDGRTVAVILLEVVELDAYRQTFGANAADSCLRMIGAQLAGTFGRASDLCARYDATTFVAATQGQGLDTALALAERVKQKTRNLGLHNPRATTERYITLRCAGVESEAGRDDVERLLSRARAKLEEFAPKRRSAAG